MIGEILLSFILLWPNTLPTLLELTCLTFSPNNLIFTEEIIIRSHHIEWLSDCTKYIVYIRECVGVSVGTGGGQSQWLWRQKAYIHIKWKFKPILIILLPIFKTSIAPCS